jgi:hypothetical protein
MSILGTGLASSVASTAQQTQQIVTQRDRITNQPAHEARRVRETFEAHLRDLEEGEENESPDRVHIDGKLPEHQSPSQGNPEPENKPKKGRNPALSAEDETLSNSSVVSLQAAHGLDQDALYHHLDIQA